MDFWIITLFSEYELYKKGQYIVTSRLTRFCSMYISDESSQTGEPAKREQERRNRRTDHQKDSEQEDRKLQEKEQEDREKEGRES